MEDICGGRRGRRRTEDISARLGRRGGEEGRILVPGWAGEGEKKKGGY